MESMLTSRNTLIKELRLKVPFAKPYFSESDIEAILSGMRAVLESGWLTSGKNVEAFEQEFAELIGTRYAVAMNSCTAALHAIFLALDIKYGDEVIVPANTFVATANTALYVGAKPVFADSDKDTFNISSNDAEKRITKNTLAMVPVHLAGNPCDMKELSELAEDNHILMIEDCAHAHDAKYQGKNCGSLGVASAFSFYSTKVMTSGEGGMVTTDDKDIADRVRKIRNHGRGGYGPQENSELGYNFRLTDVLAVIGRNQLSHLPEFLAQRHKIAKEYDRLFSRVPWVKSQLIRPGNYCSYYTYVVKLGPEAPFSRDELMRKLSERGIGTSILYHPVPTQPLYNDGYGEKINVPVALDLGRSSIALPMYNGMSEEELRYVKDNLIEVLAKRQETIARTV